MLDRPAVTARVRTGAVVVAAAVVLAACSGGSTDVTPAPSASSSACTKALALLPASVLGQARATLAVTGAAAYGSPAIVVRCGLPALAATSDPCLTVDGVDWVAQPDGDPIVLTTFGRSPAVEVRIPASYGRTNASGAAVDLKPVAAALPTNGRACIG